MQGLTRYCKSEQLYQNINFMSRVMNKYEVIIYWSDKDELFIAEVPELPGCYAHGKTKMEALEQADQAGCHTLDRYGKRIRASGSRTQRT